MVGELLLFWIDIGSVRIVLINVLKVIDQERFVRNINILCERQFNRSKKKYRVTNKAERRQFDIYSHFIKIAVIKIIH